MKTIKLLSSLLLASAFMVGCSDDDIDLNTADCTVGFQSAEKSVKESDGRFLIPINVTGDQNGLVNVVVSVEEYGKNPAKEDTHYLVTDKTLSISSDDKTVNLEILSVDDEEINEARTFVVKLVSAQGAKVSSENDAIIVTVKDNDSNFYEKLPGNFEYSDALGQKVKGVKIMSYPEGNPAYEKDLVISFDFGLPANAILNYNFDMATKKMTLSMEAGQMMLSDVNAGDPFNIDLVSALKKDGKYMLSGTSTWDVSEDFKTLKHNDENGEFVILVFKTGTNQFAGPWIESPGLTLTKK